MRPALRTATQEALAPLSGTDQRCITHALSLYSQLLELRPHLAGAQLHEDVLQQAAEWVIRIRKYLDARNTAFGVQALQRLVNHFTEQKDSRHILRSVVRSALRAIAEDQNTENLHSTNVDILLDMFETKAAFEPLPQGGRRGAHVDWRAHMGQLLERVRHAAEQVTIKPENSHMFIEACSLLDRAHALFTVAAFSTNDALAPDELLPPPGHGASIRIGRSPAASSPSVTPLGASWLADSAMSPTTESASPIFTTSQHIPTRREGRGSAPNGDPNLLPQTSSSSAQLPPVEIRAPVEQTNTTHKPETHLSPAGKSDGDSTEAWGTFSPSASGPTARRGRRLSTGSATSTGKAAYNQEQTHQDPQGGHYTNQTFFSPQQSGSNSRPSTARRRSSLFGGAVEFVPPIYEFVGSGPKVNVGPVIGMVTANRARVLVEVPYAGKLSCTLTHVYDGAEDGEAAFSDPVIHAVEVEAKANRPVVFAFYGLSSHTKYLVRVEGYTHVPSAFRTLPEKPTLADRMSFAVVACNKIRTTKECVQDQRGCLWRHLAEQGKSEDVTMALHLGDQVYGDDDYEAMEKGNVSVEVGMGHCMYAQADELLQLHPKSEWNLLRERVTELYRSTYRETWGYYWTALALANVPNIMQYDDHEIRDDFGDKPEEFDLNSRTRFIAECARRSIMEYQRQLIDDIDLGNPNFTPPLLNENHFHVAVGEVGLLFVDTRGAKVFNFRLGDPYPFITSAQWSQIDDALSENGIFKDCKILLFLTQIPMIFFSAAMTERIAAKADDFEGMWTYRTNISEQTRMLNALEGWKARGHGKRSIALSGGDVHLGGFTEVFKAGAYMFRQIIVGPISNKTLGKLAMVGTHLIKGTQNELQDNWTYNHYKWRRERNYGVIRLTPESQDENEPVGISWSHIVGTDNTTKEIKPSQKIKDDNGKSPKGKEGKEGKEGKGQKDGCVIM